MVNLELYRVFYTVAKCGSLTKAASLLYISQPAVSQSIKQLEQQLGTPLFNRTHRGMELSEQGGKLIFKEVEKALMTLDNVENSLSELTTSATGTIRIGATDSIFAHVLSDKIVAFHEQYPSVKLELITGTSIDTLQQLKEKKCDVGFLNLPIEDKNVHITGTLVHLNDIFVVGNKYAHLKDRKLSYSDLQELPLLMIENNTVARRAISSFTKSIGVDLVPSIEVANWDFMAKLAVNGMGVGCIPREYCKGLLESGELFELDVMPVLPVRGVGIALPDQMPVSYALKQFIAMCEWQS